MASINKKAKKVNLTSSEETKALRGNFYIYPLGKKAEWCDRIIFLCDKECHW